MKLYQTEMMKGFKVSSGNQRPSVDENDEKTNTKRKIHL